MNRLLVTFGATDAFSAIPVFFFVLIPLAISLLAVVAALIWWWLR